jgi:hypothetical protein
MSETIEDLVKLNVKLHVRLAIYQRFANRVDDYFEYANESEKDRMRVHDLLRALTEELQR